MLQYRVRSLGECESVTLLFLAGQVRKEQTEISMALIREVMDKRVMGTAGSRLPDSEAKRRLAMVAAARAVVVATTPGMPPLQRMSILPRGDNITRTLFMPQASLRSRHKTPSSDRIAHPSWLHQLTLKEAPRLDSLSCM